MPSVTRTVIGNEPGWVGMPASTPPVESVSPAGNTPLFSVNVAPPTAPACVNVSLNAAFTVPTVLAGFVTVIVRSCRKNGDHYDAGCEFEKTPPWNVLLLFG